MSKNKRTHGEQMSTLGEVNALYEIVNIIMNKIKKLEIIIKKAQVKERENK